MRDDEFTNRRVPLPRPEEEEDVEGCSMEPACAICNLLDDVEPDQLVHLAEILQMNPKPASMFAFSRPSCKTDARC